MSLFPLEIPPGVYRNGTETQSAGRWYDASLVRWVDNVLQPIGGWSAIILGTINEPIRSAHSWRDNSYVRWVATGSANTLQIIEDDDTTVLDRTPAGLAAGSEITTASADATVWSLDNWGENLLALSSADGRIFEWLPSTPSVLPVVVAGAPTGCRGLVVTDERFVMALMPSNNPRKIAWSDREDNTVWTPAINNEAGDIELQTRGVIRQGLRVTGETLILTSQDVWAATYVGPPYVYGFRRVGTNCGAISRQSGVSIEDRAFWMGRRGFFMYDGGRVVPLRCEVESFIFDTLTVTQRAQVHAVSNARYSEVWWFYPTGQDTEISRYVFYNYKDDTWGIGEMRRTAAIDAGATDFPWWFDNDTVYKHEYETFKGGNLAFAESGPVTLGAGDQRMMVRSVLSDQTPGVNSVQVTFYAKDYPLSAEYTYGPYREANPIDVRFTAREVRTRWSEYANGAWRVGTPRLDIVPTGGR